MKEQLTLGEYRVGINPFVGKGYPVAEELKSHAAAFIDRANSSDEAEKDAATLSATAFKEKCHELETVTDNPEGRRCFQIAFSWAEQAEKSLDEGQREIAVTQFEAACMWAVRGATKPELPEHLKY